jgi:iron complex outermembrane receptor protein
MDDHFELAGRLSALKSDILIVQVLIWNRISCKEHMWKTTLIKALAFGGKEKPINPGMVSMQKQ